MPVDHNPADPAERADTERLEAQARLVARHPGLTLLADMLPDAVVVLNPQRQIVFANRAFSQLIGLNDDAGLLGLRLGEALGCAHRLQTELGCGETPRCNVCGAVQAIRASLANSPDQRQCHFLRKDGCAFELRVSTQPWDCDGEHFAVCHITDVSAEHHARHLDRLFCHDLLDQAGGAMGLAEQMLAGQGAAMDPDLVLLHRQLEDVVETIETQRDNQMAEAGHLRVDFETITCGAFMEHLVDHQRHAAAAHGCALDLGVVAAAQTVRSNRVLLRRVINNMIKNAYEAAGWGETVRIACERQQDDIVFSVHNPGVIPPAIAMQVFDRHYSTKGAGRGLGCYCMKLLGEGSLRGRVGFRSETDFGTRFWIRLPAAS